MVLAGKDAVGYACFVLKKKMENRNWRKDE